MRKIWMGIVILAILVPAAILPARTILVPKQVDGAPFKYEDTGDLFGKSYRWFLEGEHEWAVDSLKKLISNAGYRLDPKAYYVVVANFADNFSPIGLIHAENAFLSRRMYGLGQRNLFYIFISRRPDAESFLSVIATEKESPFLKNLPEFINLFLPLLGQAPGALKIEGEAKTTWLDVRQFTIPKEYQKYSEFSFLVKKSLDEKELLASADLDNTALERWSYGIGTAITTVNDVDIIIGNDGTIIVQPKPDKDLATFGVINYHFNPVDTKAKTFGTSYHLLGGFRIARTLEPILGAGAGFDLGVIDLHFFAGYSVEFANQLKAGFAIGDTVKHDISPFKLKIRGKPRFGLEVKFP